MDFVIEYYIWFLIAGIIMIMALIGYIAEKTEFVKEKKPKEQKKNKVPEETIEPEATISESEVVTLEEASHDENAEMMEWDMPQINENASQIAENVQSTDVDETMILDENNLANENEDVVDLFEDVIDAPQSQDMVSEMEIPKEEETITADSNDNDDNSEEIVSMDSDTEENESEDIVADEDIWKF